MKETFRAAAGAAGVGRQQSHKGSVFGQFELSVIFRRQLHQLTTNRVAEAQHSPETARSLFALASFGRRDPESLERLHVTYTKEEIHLEFLSHYMPDRPFAYLSMNDGLNDTF